MTLLRFLARLRPEPRSSWARRAALAELAACADKAGRGQGD